MAVLTYTKSGGKASTAARLDKTVFDVEVANHELLKQAYVSYLANGRTNNAVALKRGEVSGGGKKPWKQKGTGRARFGSTRNPIWRGGGVAFGPTGNENYAKGLSVNAKRQALRQALTVANKAGKLRVIETFECKDGKVNETLGLLTKIGVSGRILLVVSQKDELVERATRNIQSLQAVQARYLNVFDILNADTVLLSSKSLDIIHEWLGNKSVATVKESK